MNEVHPAIRILGELGFVTFGEPGLLVEDLSRSHLVTRVSSATTGASFVVKTPRPQTFAGGRDLGGELAVYRLATWLDSITEAVPEPLLIDEARQLLVLRADGIGPSLAAEPPDTVWAGARLGHAMGRWHRDTRGMLLGAGTRPFAVDLVERTPVALGTLGTAAQSLGQALLADPGVGVALRRVAADWTPDCLVHGDVKWENCLFDGPPGARRGVRVADWELAAFGDPAWDVGCAVGELEGACALHGGEPSVAVRALIEAYSAAWRPPDEATLARIANAAVVRVAQAAIEHTEVGATEIAARLVATARSLAADPGALRRACA